MPTDYAQNYERYLATARRQGWTFPRGGTVAFLDLLGSAHKPAPAPDLAALQRGERWADAAWSAAADAHGVRSPGAQEWDRLRTLLNGAILYRTWTV